MLLYKQISDVLGFISSYSYYGIKLDIIAHLAIGTILFITAKRFISIKASFIVVLSLTLLKEVHDTQIMTNTFNENVKDIIFSLLIPILLISYKKINQGRESLQ